MTADAPLLSVTVVDHHDARHLDQCLQSLLAQTWTDLEIVLVDDGPMDGSSTVVDRYRADPRVRVIDHPVHRGFAPSLVEGSAASTSKYLTAVSADDWVLDPRAFELQIALLESDDEIAFAWTAYGCFGERAEPDEVVQPWTQARVLPRAEALYEVLVERRVPRSGTVIRRRAYEALGGYDVAMRDAIDTKMWAGLCHVGTVGYVPELCHASRLHASNTSMDTSVVESTIDELLDIFDWSRELLLVDERLDLEWIYATAERRALAAYPVLFAFRRNEIRLAWHFVAFGARRRFRTTVFQPTTVALAARTLLGRRLFGAAERAGRTLLRRRSSLAPSP